MCSSDLFFQLFFTPNLPEAFLKVQGFKKNSVCGGKGGAKGQGGAGREKEVVLGCMRCQLYD